MGTYNMFSLQLAVCVCVLLTIGIEAAPEPKPRCWYPPCHYGESGFPTRYSPYYNRASGGDYNNYYYNRASGGDYNSYYYNRASGGDYNNYYYNRGGASYDPRCDGTGKAFCCNWGVAGIDCGCYC